MKKWLFKQKSSSMFHVIPLEDGYDHQLTSTCPCEPEAVVEDKTGSLVLTHVAQDERKQLAPDNETTQAMCRGLSS